MLAVDGRRPAPSSLARRRTNCLRFTVVERVPRTQTQDIAGAAIHEAVAGCRSASVHCRVVAWLSRVAHRCTCGAQGTGIFVRRAVGSPIPFGTGNPWNHRAVPHPDCHRDFVFAAAPQVEGVADGARLEHGGVCARAGSRPARRTRRQRAVGPTNVLGYKRDTGRSPRPSHMVGGMASDPWTRTPRAERVLNGSRHSLQLEQQCV